ncbi:PrsW family glutamic-type intramembrane protease [Corynebacterium ulcerans]|uniref:PrsW family glutamic-type intramembrane protease n=1 Tax=Corynebacterium ulcerans TaxID=65058 RepID=UPI001CD1AFF6|nr:PrsW family glutamic-type intramembrane protease [Corynebacterium ulcerans]MDK8889593.1 PrsW family glutamic-type intramembrane protease [Corynebacterium ulcerans]
MYLVKTLSRELQAMPLISLYILLICVAGGVLVFGIFVLIDRSGLRKDKNNRIIWIDSLIFGGLVGPLLAVRINGEISRVFPAVIGLDFYKQWGEAIFGPMSEEWIKLAITLAVILLYRKWIVRPMHAFFVGAFVGLGFQLTEDFWFSVRAAFEDVDSDLTGGITLSVFRVLFGVVSHWTYTGIAAIGLCYLLNIGKVSEKYSVRIFTACGFFLLSLSLHGLWNSPITFGVSDAIAPLGRLLMILIIFFVFARWLCKKEKAAVMEKNGEFS